MDRRVARTRDALHAALVKLMLARGYDAVSVEDICAEANVGRSTFYAHFTGKDDLKRSGLETIAHALHPAPGHAPGAPHPPGFSLAMFRHAEGHADHYRALAGGSGGTLALSSIRKMLAEEVRRELKRGGFRLAQPDVAPDFAAEYLVGAFMAVLTWWLDHGAVAPPERMDEMFRAMAGPALAPRPGAA
jgi:AcrR family transcriptional regulator